MNIKCFFGKHDWKEVKTFTEKFVIDNLLKSGLRRYAVSREQSFGDFMFRSSMPADHIDKTLGQYICLRCCAVKDEVKEFLDRCNYDCHKLAEEEQQRAERKKQASMMLKSCAKSKLVGVSKKGEKEN